jgi:uncharacterized metal-binding protein YceD (DUF177 family)
LNGFDDWKLKTKITIMLSVNLRHLEEKEIHLAGELSAAKLNLDLHDEMIRAEKPLHYDLTAEKLHDAILVTGELSLILDCECVRCLKPFAHKIHLKNWALHLPLTGEDKVAVDNDCVDLTPFVREDILLEFPQHPLCGPNCAGLKKKKKFPKAGDKTEKPDAWVALDKLKFN